MKAFITGITGFAGTHLAEHLLACGDEVLGSSRQGGEESHVPETVSQHVEVVAWDISAPLGDEARRRIADFQPDCIFHLAAISIPADCGGEHPTPRAVATNVDGTRRVLELASALPHRPRVLLTSSCYVYAPVSFEQPQVCENAPLGPTSAYGKTKLAAEEEVTQAIEKNGVDAVIARIFQHTGPRQSARMIVPQWAKQFAAGGKEPIKVGSLQTYLDLSDVRDIVRAYRKLALNEKSDVVYNVGSGVCRSSGDLYEQLCRLQGDDRQVVEHSPGRRQHPVADISRITGDTDWRPEIPLETTLADTLDYWNQ